MNDHTFTLEEELTLYQVAQVQKDLLQAFEQGCRRFNLGHINTLDGAGVQLLLALVKTASAQEEAIEWTEVSAETRHVFAELGLEPLTHTDIPITRTPT